MAKRPASTTTPAVLYLTGSRQSGVARIIAFRGEVGSAVIRRPSMPRATACGAEAIADISNALVEPIRLRRGTTVRSTRMNRPCGRSPHGGRLACPHALLLKAQDTRVAAPAVVCARRKANTACAADTQAGVTYPSPRHRGVRAGTTWATTSDYLGVGRMQWRVLPWQKKKKKTFGTYTPMRGFKVADTDTGPSASRSSPTCAT